ncbi:MAG TPA: hypothetical protein VH740_07445 [Vicinamibacterales bacterium]
MTDVASASPRWLVSRLFDLTRCFGGAACSVLVLLLVCDRSCHTCCHRRALA